VPVAMPVAEGPRQDHGDIDRAILVDPDPNGRQRTALLARR
jgi:hypothetical protein